MKNILFLIIVLVFQFSFAQKEDDNIGTEVVNVVKPYSPTVSDANKIKEVPPTNDEVVTSKKDVNYQIFSYPVASTFTPAKGKAAGVEKAKQDRLFSNYATLGVGNYLAATAELFVTHELDKYQYVAGRFHHQSSQGGIKGVLLDNKYAERAINAIYGYQRNETNFTANLGYKNEIYNWYGIPLQNPYFNVLTIDDINVNHQYNTFTLASQLGIERSVFKQLNFNYTGFLDNYKSAENRFEIKPIFHFDFGDTKIKTKFGVDYLNTSFATSYGVMNTQENDYAIQKSNFMASVNPSFQILKDDLSLELGAELTYFSILKDTYNGIKTNPKASFFIYPKASVSYKVVGDLMIAFGEAQGKLIQNSYANFTAQNKFLSPTLLIQPTDQQYEISAGLRGKLSSVISYIAKASYNASKNMALYKSNPLIALTSGTSNYNYTLGNSFTIVYDNVVTSSFYGELKADVNKNIHLGLNLQLNTYSMDKENQPWNLPMIKSNFTTNFNIGKKWYAGTQLFYVGERKDAFTTTGFAQNINTEQNLEGYFDINAHIDYKYNDRFTTFIKGNNLANQNYNAWLNYPVQGAQIIVGLHYKFDF